MKLHENWAVALIAAAAVCLTGCDKKEDPDNAGNGGGGDPQDAAGDPAPAPDPDPTPAPDPEPTPDPDPEPAGGNIAEQLKGVWAPDVDATVAALREEADVPEAQLGFIKMMAGLMLIELNDGEAKLHSPDGIETETYTIVSADEATGEFVVNMVSEDGTEEKGEGMVSGDKLVMKSDEMPLHLVRLNDEEAEAKKEAIANFDPSTLIPGGGELPIPIPGEDGSPDPIPVPDPDEIEIDIDPDADTGSEIGIDTEDTADPDAGTEIEIGDE